MLMLLVLWILAPLLTVALGAAMLFAVAIIVEGVRTMFSGKD